MPIVFASQIATTLPLQVLAQAYGMGSYDSNTYNGTGSTAAPLPPNTGVWLQSPVVDITLLLALSLIVGTISFVISRLLRRRKSDSHPRL